MDKKLVELLIVDKFGTGLGNKFDLSYWCSY